MFSIFGFGFFPSPSGITVEVHLSSLTAIFFELHSREATQETPARLLTFTSSGAANRQAGHFLILLVQWPVSAPVTKTRTSEHRKEGNRWDYYYTRLPAPDRSLTHNQLSKSLHSSVCAPI